MASAPEGFSWVVPDALAAMARPYDLRPALEYLSDEKIGVIVSLTETPLRASLIDEFGLEYHHMPLRDFTAPDYDTIREFVTIVQAAQQRGKRAVVHCLAGRGRTGTMAACYLVSMGASSREAIERIRALRPGSVETLEQEEAVHEYAFRSRNDRK